MLMELNIIIIIKDNIKWLLYRRDDDLSEIVKSRKFPDKSVLTKENNYGFLKEQMLFLFN